MGRALKWWRSNEGYNRANGDQGRRYSYHLDSGCYEVYITGLDAGPLAVIVSHLNVVLSPAEARAVCQAVETLAPCPEAQQR